MPCHPNRPRHWRMRAALEPLTATIVAAVLVGIVMTPASALPEDAPPPARTVATLTVCRDVSGSEGMVVRLASRTTSQDGKPVVDECVRFRVKQEGRWEDLGVTKTSRRGAASVKYRIPLRSSTPPKGKGDIPFVAELLPRQPLQLSKGSGLIHIVPVVQPLTPSEQ